MAKHVVVRGELKADHRRAAAEAVSRGCVVLLPCAQNYLLISRSEERLRSVRPARPAAGLTNLGTTDSELTLRLVRDRKEFDALLLTSSAAAVKLADAFLPGELTLAVNSRAGKISVMMPDSSLIAGLASQVNDPLFLREILDCDSGSDLAKAYADQVDLWLDIGRTRLTPSTLVDITGRWPQVRRKGAIPIFDVERVLGSKVKLGSGVVFTVLFVCTGNTCRSAMAKAILEHRLPGQRVLVDSAGTSAAPDMPASDGARRAMQEQGADLERHRSTLLTARQIRDADLIIGMESRHRQRVVELVPGAESRTLLLSSFAGRADSEAIYDPIGSSLEVFREVAKIIAEALERVAQDIEWRLTP